MLLNGFAAGTYIDPVTEVSHSFSSKTWIHGNTIACSAGRAAIVKMAGKTL